MRLSTKVNTTVLFISFILFGCSSTMATPLIMPTSQATSALIVPTSTITVMPSPLATVEPDAPQNCIALKPIDFDLAELSGLLAVSSREAGYHLLDPKTNQFVDVDKDGNQIFYPSFLEISPNKKYMLAYTKTYDYFVVKAVDQLIETKVPVSKDWELVRWLDNEHVAFQSVKGLKQELIVWDPFTGEQKTVGFNFPNGRVWQPGTDFAMFEFTVDPTLSRVLYLDKENRLILWNEETQREMASLSPPADQSWLSIFAWSRDGTKFAMPWPEGPAKKPLANELYAFNMVGKLETLTNLNQKYKFANVKSPSWSPNDHSIGFWLRISNGDYDPLKFRQWLAVLDTNTLETRVYCLADKYWSGGPNEIIWSPDGQQLIVRFGSISENNLRTLLVDLVHQTQSVINAKGLYVNDWMAP